MWNLAGQNQYVKWIVLAAGIIVVLYLVTGIWNPAKSIPAAV